MAGDGVRLRRAGWRVGEGGGGDRSGGGGGGDRGQAAGGVVGVAVPVGGGTAFSGCGRGGGAAGAGLCPGLCQAGEVVVGEALHVGGRAVGGWGVGFGGDVAGIVVAVVQVIRPTRAQVTESPKSSHP